MWTGKTLTTGIRFPMRVITIYTGNVIIAHTSIFMWRGRSTELQTLHVEEKRKEKSLSTVIYPGHALSTHVNERWFSFKEVSETNRRAGPRRTGRREIGEEKEKRVMVKLCIMKFYKCFGDLCFCHYDYHWNWWDATTNDLLNCQKK